MASLLFALLSACGYQPVASLRLPRPGALFVAAPRAATSDEPRFSPLYVGALVRELARRGVRVRATSGALRLDTRVSSLRAGGPSVSRRRVARRELVVELSVRLSDRGQTLWRSALLRERFALPLAVDAGESERARRAIVLRLAERAAQRVGEALSARFQ